MPQVVPASAVDGNAEAGAGTTASAVSAVSAVDGRRQADAGTTVPAVQAGPTVSGTTAQAFEPPPLMFWPPNRRRSRSGLGAEHNIRTAACSRSGQGGTHPRVQHDSPDEQRLDLPDVRQRQLVPPWLLHRWPGPVLDASRSDLAAGGLVLLLRQPQLGPQNRLQQVELQPTTGPG